MVTTEGTWVKSPDFHTSGVTAVVDVYSGPQIRDPDRTGPSVMVATVDTYYEPPYSQAIDNDDVSGHDTCGEAPGS